MNKFYADNSLDQAIRSDGALLASVVTLEEIQQDDDAVWQKFKAAGGDDSHSGASWACVKYVAIEILRK